MRAKEEKTVSSDAPYHNLAAQQDTAALSTSTFFLFYCKFTQPIDHKELQLNSPVVCISVSMRVNTHIMCTRVFTGACMGLN